VWWNNDDSVEGNSNNNIIVISFCSESINIILCNVVLLLSCFTLVIRCLHILYCIAMNLCLSLLLLILLSWLLNRKNRAGISADQATGGQGEDVRPPVASSLLCAGRASNNCVCRQNMTGITEGEARPRGQDRRRSP